MLTPEAAKKQLDQWRAEEGDRLVSVAKKLPAKISNTALLLMGKNGRSEAEELSSFNRIAPSEKRRGMAAAQLDALSAKERRLAFIALFGPLAPSVEAGWQTLKNSIYQTDFGRKAFRAPDLPAATTKLRGDWLVQILDVIEQFKPGTVTAPWLAAWTPHLGFRVNQDAVGRLLAAAIDLGGSQGDEVFDILCQSVRNEHLIGAMGRHVSRALLMSSRSEGWELMEKTLLAAQRQEGLRQVIVETIDEAHPQAFRRMLRLIRENGLARFSSVVRAVDCWFGMQWEATEAKTVYSALDRVATFLDDAKARDKALAGAEPETIFLALWSIAYDDALVSIPPAAKLLKHKQPAVRFVAAMHLNNLDLPQTEAARMTALDDEDLRVADCALSGMHHSRYVTEINPELFEPMERFFHRMPRKPVTLKPMVWPWDVRIVSQEEIAGRLALALGDRPLKALLPYLGAMDAEHRARVVEMITEDKKQLDAETRQTLVRLVGDAASEVRQSSCKALEKIKLQAEDYEILEGFLTRKSSDLRQGVLGHLLRQTDAQAINSARRLIAAKDAMQRLAALELLRQLAKADRLRDECRKLAAEYQAARKKLTREEQTQLEAIAAESTEQITLDNALGLMNPADRSPAVPPRPRKVQFVTKAAVGCIESLDTLVHQHRETQIEYKIYGTKTVELLGNVRWGFPSPDWNKPLEKNKPNLPLAEVWEEWYAKRPKSLRDADGLELLRAIVWLGVADDDWTKKTTERKKILKTLSGGFRDDNLKYAEIVKDLVTWMMYLHPPKGMVDFLLDATETSFTLVSKSDMQKLAGTLEEGGYFNRCPADWRKAYIMELWPDALSQAIYRGSIKLSPQQTARWWQLLRWLDEPFAGAARRRPNFSKIIACYDHGAANMADLTDHVLGPDRDNNYNDYESLSALTSRDLNKETKAFVARHAEVAELIDRCRARIVEIELARGEMPTAATEAAWHVGSLYGTELLFRLLTALGKEGIRVPVGWSKTNKESRTCTLTRLASVVYPKPDETCEDFRRLAKKAEADGLLSEKTIIELAFLAPQWANHVEAYLGWNGFAEALYWFLAHMHYAGGKDKAAVAAGVEDTRIDADDEDDDLDDDDNNNENEQPQKKLSPWEKLVAQRTPLSEMDRDAGAVDVAWFRRIYAAVTPKRWLAMAEAAKFAANSAQARHAQFIADVLTGKAARKQLIDGVRKKKLKDYVRMLGLYPLAAGAKRQADLVERYNVLQEYRRYARGLSAMSKPEAMRSIDVGMRNLASTAGYADPMRLEWAMEAEQVGRLAKGPVSVAKDGVTITLALDADARPQLTIQRGEKALKSAPPAVKKDKRVAELLEQAANLKRQASRMKASLEAAMCRGDIFTGEELGQLCRHAILAPLIGRLVLVGEGIMGYPDRGGKALRDASGKLEPVKKTETLRIAHAHDLLLGGEWDKYQRECFQAERVQPFKQVFRELYVVTKQERQDSTLSRRYAGHQVQPRQALALWGQRGWNTQDGVWKTFHDEGLTVSVSFQNDFGTPAEVEGLTVASVDFRRRDEYKPLKLTDVPPRIFSEAMRDMDLVVSVAHAGGVDPEASASTVEMRARLLGETCSLLSLKNVRLKDSHVLIDGRLGNYSVHLGSAVVHRMPGGAVCLTAVPAQHRGRLFLPFADDDPRTAEVIAKTILLARDHEIQDPTILEQLRA
jgi:hypothetical protein